MFEMFRDIGRDIFVSGLVSSRPERAPVMVTSSIGLPSNGPPHLPSLARNSTMTLRLNSNSSAVELNPSPASRSSESVSAILHPSSLLCF